jgi:hypothetical protein
VNDAARGPAGVADYKRVLQAVIDARPSGTRQRLATALGTTRSFISQIVNPLYPLPVPGQHLEAIFEVCRFSQVERAAFLAAYVQAHPGRLAALGGVRTRAMSIVLPDLGDPRLNDLVDDALADVVHRLSRLARDLRAPDPCPPADPSGDLS